VRGELRREGGGFKRGVEGFCSQGPTVCQQCAPGCRACRSPWRAVRPTLRAPDGLFGLWVPGRFRAGRGLPVWPAVPAFGKVVRGGRFEGREDECPKEVRSSITPTLRDFAEGAAVAGRLVLGARLRAGAFGFGPRGPLRLRYAPGVSFVCVARDALAVCPPPPALPIPRGCPPGRLAGGKAQG
ncbi:hypothetical protein KI387_042155, partial [Taxus chinensis]